MTFEALDGGRCRIVGVSVVDSMELRDMILSSGMEVGVNEGYAKLDELLAGLLIRSGRGRAERLRATQGPQQSHLVYTEPSPEVFRRNSAVAQTVFVS